MLSRILKILAPDSITKPSSVPEKKESPFDDLPEDVKKEYDKLIAILPNMLIDKRADRLALGMIRRFLEFVWDLPASESHHHSCPFGLFLHSLETAINNLKSFENKLFFQFRDGTIDSYETRVVKPREQYAYFLTGLLSDIGEAAKYSFSTERSESRKIDWMVKYLQDLFNEMSREADAYVKFHSLMNCMPDIMSDARDILISKINDQSMDESWNVIDDPQIREIYAHLIAGLLHDIGKASEVIIISNENDKWCPLREGLYFFMNRNGGNVRRDYIANKTYALHQKMTPVFTSLIMTPGDYNYIGPQNFSELIMGNKFKGTIESDMRSTAADISESASRNDIAGPLLEAVRNLLTSGRYALNTRMPGAWIMDDHTAVASHIIDEARITLQNEGYKVTNAMVLKTLTENKYVKVEEGWKSLYMMTIETKGSPFQQKVMQFKNDVLWNDIGRPGLCTLNLKFAILQDLNKQK